MHTIIHLYDADGNRLDFFRVKCKRPETALKTLAKAIQNYPNLYRPEGLYEIVCNYTDYASTAENETSRMTIEAFDKKYMTA